MPLLPRWLRPLARSTKAPARTLRPAASSRPQVEALEDRALPSVSPLTLDQYYSQWRSDTFRVDDLYTAVGPTASTPATATASSVNQSFGSQIGLNQVLADGQYKGTGEAVVVIDTGIDYNHPDLGGGWGKRVIAGWDFVNNDADPMDDNGHGTNVAGIIGSSNAAYSGIAPNVNLIALKVLGKDGSGSFGAVEDALKWVVANRARYNIVSINMSLGSGNYTSNPYTFLEDEFATLKSQGVFIAVAAGNNFYAVGSQPGLDFPAVSPNVVSVGAVWNGNQGAVSWLSGARDNTTAVDRIASFSQRGPALSIVAPGAMIRSTYLNGGYADMAGTSMASPVIAGAAALLRQALDATGKQSLANQDYILSLMKSTGVNVVDGDDEDDNVVNTGLTFKRLDLLAAMKAATSNANQNSAPVLSDIGDRQISAGQTITVDLNATDADNDAITYSARIVGGTTVDSPAYTLKQQLGLSYVGQYYTNLWGQNEKWLGGANGNWYLLMPNGDLRRWAGTVSSTMLASNLVKTLSADYYVDPSLLWNAQSGGYIPAKVSVSGNRLTIAADANFTGSVQIEASATDGKTVVTKSFAAGVQAASNRAPVWTPIANQTMSPRQGSITVNLNATDADGDAITYSAVVADSSGGNGGTKNGTFSATPRVQFSFAGNRLTITPPEGFTGAFAVEVTANDGKTTSKTTFNVTSANQAPTLGDIANVAIGAGQSSKTLNLTAGDPDGDAITISASVVSTQASGGQAYQLDQSLGLSYLGSYFQGFKGGNEKWMYSRNQGAWIAILPNGEVRKIGSTLSQMMQASNLIATLEASYYADPSKLWNATAPTTPNLSATVSGNQLTIARNSAFVGTAVIEVVISDGFATTKKQFAVTFA
ncbi:MAG: S8 family serine peptidase [Gemmataceae bacterium]|nr:S8 family serine peptidase [Gemmataceae bacterium]